MDAIKLEEEPVQQEVAPQSKDGTNSSTSSEVGGATTSRNKASATSTSTKKSWDKHKKEESSKLSYIIPGLTNPIDIPFPDKKLPVCSRCKNIYKTRDLCRLRDGHKTVPWCTTYICFILDDSCITKDLNGDNVLVREGPYKFIATSIKEPPPETTYRVKPGWLLSASNSSAVCGTCKKKNYTKENCREKHRHNELPWTTVYVSLSAVACTDPVTGARNGSTEDDDGTLGHNRNTIENSGVPGNDNGYGLNLNDYNYINNHYMNNNNNRNTEPSRFHTPYAMKIGESKAFLLTIYKDQHHDLMWLQTGPEDSSLTMNSAPPHHLSSSFSQEYRNSSGSYLPNQMVSPASMMSGASLPYDRQDGSNVSRFSLTSDEQFSFHHNMRDSYQQYHQQFGTNQRRNSFPTRPPYHFVNYSIHPSHPQYYVGQEDGNYYDRFNEQNGLFPGIQRQHMTSDYPNNNMAGYPPPHGAQQVAGPSLSGFQQEESSLYNPNNMNNRNNASYYHG